MTAVLESSHLALTATAAGWLLTYLLHSTVLLGTAWLASRFLRSAAWAETLWKVALVGGLVTATVPLPALWRIETPLAPAPRPHAETAAAAAEAPGVPAGGAIGPAGASIGRRDAAAPDFAAPSRHPEALESEAGSGGGSARAVMSATAASPKPGRLVRGESADPGTTAGVLVILLWAAAAAARLLASGGRYLRFLRRLGRRRVVEADLLASTRQLAAAIGLARPPRLTRSEALQVPIALAGGEVCLSGRFAELSAPQQRSILAHELAHLRRHDPYWLLIGEAVCAVLFFQPLNRLAQRRLKEACEQLCDDLALASVGDPLALAEALKSLAAGLLRCPALPIAAVVDGRSALVRRVARVLTPARERAAATPLRGTVVGAAALLLVALAPSWAASTEGERDAAPSPPASTPAVDRPALGPAAVPPAALATAAPLEPAHTPVAAPAAGSGATFRDDLEAAYLDLELRHTADHDARGNPTLLELRAKGVRVPLGRAEILGIDRGGHLEARQERGGIVRRLRVEPTPDGTLRHRFWVDGEARPFDQRAEEWLAGLLDVERFPVYYPGAPLAPAGVAADPAEPALADAPLAGAGRTWNAEHIVTSRRDGVPMKLEILARDVVLHPSEPRVLTVRPGGLLVVREDQGDYRRSYTITNDGDRLHTASSCDLPQTVEQVETWAARVLREHLLADDDDGRPSDRRRAASDAYDAYDAYDELDATDDPSGYADDRERDEVHDSLDVAHDEIREVGERERDAVHDALDEARDQIADAGDREHDAAVDSRDAV